MLIKHPDLTIINLANFIQPKSREVKVCRLGDRKFVTVFTTQRNEAVCPRKHTLLVPMFNAKLLPRSHKRSNYISMSSTTPTKRKVRYKQDTLKYQSRAISKPADVLFTWLRQNFCERNTSHFVINMAILYYRLVTSNCFRNEMHTLYAEKYKAGTRKR